ncbi:hypothetical protein CIPAW_04G075300 [Carya illinoinensis]|uniref:DUF4371 domain-containing protein n=1 Tax=Carya illinoinensis TaxID=32201 RepID=A0A8T1QRP0_CARIL|nr:hypothetical protein CIPAW_04G075300 [Carya illinoinensis]
MHLNMKNLYKKKRIENLIESQKGSLNKFVSSNKQNITENLGEFVKSVEENKNTEDTSNYIPSNIYDPAQWKHVDTKLRDLFVENGPIRYNDINFPKDENSRYFSTTYYIQNLSNGEKHDRKWLVYSKDLNIPPPRNLPNTKLHNASSESKLHKSKNQTQCPPDVAPKLGNISTLLTMLSIPHVVKTLDKINLPFRGQNEKIYQENNGNFLSLIEMISEFDLVMQEHIRCYDNGSNMKGKEHGVQRILLDINVPKAFYTPCGCHNLNLVICDMANSCPEAISFFGLRWKILQDNVSILTLKPLLQTCWESRIESIKAIKFQIPQIREALLQLAKMIEDPKTKSEANCLIAYEIVNFEFILGMTICMQSKDMHIDVVIDQLKGLIAYFQDYGENGFKSTMILSKEIAIILKEILPIEENTPIDILNYIKRLDSFPNACIAYRILLIERLNELAILSIKKEILEELEYKNLISNFASQKVRRIIFK